MIQWVRALVPSNSLAALYGLARDCAERQVLGPDVAIEITALDESTTRIKVRRLITGADRARVRALVCLVGVQSNQFPRAADLGRQFRAAGIGVCIGGFHVSGSLAMIDGVQPELQEALDLGISLFAGEAESRLDQLLADAYAGRLQPIYQFLDALPDMEGTPPPYLPPEVIARTVGRETTFDAGRGCPFLCSFCTLINVQGRKSRHRSPDDIERLVRVNHANGIRHYFITDDNFSRNRQWEPILDRLIELRGEDIHLRMVIQVDTMCHRLPGFIEKAARAGVNKVFIGLETIHSEALAGAQKKQNRLSEYRQMLQAWRDVGVATYAGYILGFPNDTQESMLADIRFIQRELPIDILEFFILTPLPGCEDHKRLHEQGVWMDPDLNRYDVNHVTTAHPRMSKQEWTTAARLAWDEYYSLEHFEVLCRRARVSGIPLTRIQRLVVGFYGCYVVEGVHPLEGGLWRRKYRRDRRPGLPRPSPWVFYPQYVWQQLRKAWMFGTLYRRYCRVRLKVQNDPNASAYHDRAISDTEPVSPPGDSRVDVAASGRLTLGACAVRCGWGVGDLHGEGARTATDQCGG